MSKKISELTAVTDVTPSDLFQVVDVEDPAMASSGTNKKVTAQTLGNYLPVRALGSTTSRTLSERFGDTVNVKDFGAAGDGIQDDSVAFQAAINSLPITGGTIVANDAAYKINTAPIIGVKSVTWAFSPGVVLSGTQVTFPRFATNGDCTVTGTYTRVQSAQSTILGAATFAHAVESVQPAGDSRGYGAMFLGAQLNAPGEHSINSALNAVATANPGSSGNVFGIEINIASFASAGVGNQFGLSINGLGGNDVTFGIKIDRLDGISKYLYGINIRHSRIGVYVESTPELENAAVFGSPVTRYSDNLIQATQLSNNSANSVLLIHRKTDVSPSGFFINATNAINTSTMFSVDVLGKIFGNNLTLSGEAASTNSGSINLSAQTSTSATSGSCNLPSQPYGFIVGYNGTIPIKIPYYNA